MVSALIVMIVRGTMDKAITYITNIFIGGSKARSGQCRFNFAVGRPQQKKGKNMLELSITNEQKIKVTCNPVTAAGQAVALDGPITVDVQSGDGTVELDPDGLSFSLISGELPGDTVYVVQADADLGEGVEAISDIVQLHVEGAKAASFGLVAEEPELK
jgi:hypothetical protein